MLLFGAVYLEQLVSASFGVIPVIRPLFALNFAVRLSRKLSQVTRQLRTDPYAQSRLCIRTPGGGV